ncbi:MAG: phage tail tube protein [Candidatus Gastranaerophilales bacterium]|nr:phage tail tube protein [Candidatus Gastranaerophilales bacterium]
MADTFVTNETLNGTDGRLWVNDTLCATIQSFTLHQTNVYEDVNKSGQLSKSRRLVGIELSGTISKYKIDNSFVGLMEDYQDGETPEIKLTALVQNTTSGMMQRVVIKDVTFGEMDIISFEQKVLAKEEIPFEAESYYHQDQT